MVRDAHQRVRASALGKRAGSGGSAGGVEGLPVPGQEFGNAPRRVISNASEHVSEVVLRIETVELGAFVQRVDRAGARAAGIGAGKEIIFAANGDTAQGALGGIVVERQTAIVKATRQSGPARPHIAEGPGELGLA